MKICIGCPYIYEDCWEKGSTYCYRDKEEILPKKKELTEKNTKKGID